MTELAPAPRRVLDALHAELLGVLIDIEAKSSQIKSDMPAARQHVEGLVGEAKRAFEEMHSRSIALVGYVKNKQLETLGAIDAAHATVIADTHNVLTGFERVIWLGCGLAGVNTLLLLGLVFLSK